MQRRHLTYTKGIAITRIQNEHFFEECEQVAGDFVFAEVVAYCEDFRAQLPQVRRVEGQMTHHKGEKKYSHGPNIHPRTMITNTL